MAQRSTSRLIPFYHRVLDVLEAAEVPGLVGGAFALGHYAGIRRDTKDLDVFVMPRDVEKALAAARAAGFSAAVGAPHWLAKIRDGEDLVDLLYGSGNGLAGVDAGWFKYALEGRLDDRNVRLVAPEEMIWSKSYVMERHRYDGADVAHLIHARGTSMDWRRLLERFGPHWPVLMSHVSLFHYIYPGSRKVIPAWFTTELCSRFAIERSQPWTDGRICRGTLLSNFEYRHDLESNGYRDARLKPDGPLSPSELAEWKRHLDVEKS
ncbi:MAG: nucleotidyltransferase [Elusimicrobia bacterium]|nr:nucleotidyltransferase [Elusimicrobiota bacterium]